MVGFSWNIFFSLNKHYFYNQKGDFIKKKKRYLVTISPSSLTALTQQFSSSVFCLFNDFKMVVYTGFLILLTFGLPWVTYGYS